MISNLPLPSAEASEDFQNATLLGFNHATFLKLKVSFCPILLIQILYEVHFCPRFCIVVLGSVFFSYFLPNLNYYLSGAVCASVHLSVWVSFCKKIFFVQNGSNSQIRWTDISNSRIQAQRAWRLVNNKITLNILDFASKSELNIWTFHDLQTWLALVATTKKWPCCNDKDA